MQSVGVWSLKHDTTKPLGSTEGNMGKYLGLGKRKYNELMTREFIFKGNTPKTVTFDVGEYVCSFVGGMGS